MFKKKTKPTLQDYWEEKLHIKYEEEFEYYKKLCGFPYNRKLVHNKFSGDSELLTYNEWKQNIKCKISNMSNIEELKEYSMYINQKYRKKDEQFGLAQSLLFPFIIGIVSPMVSLFLADLVSMVSDFIPFVICCIIYMGFVIWVLHQLIKLKEDSTYKYFYSDMKEIVDEMIKATENNERAED